MTEARIIKRYANRKLYDTQHSRYVTLEQISEMVRNGDDVKIIDNKTKEDLTSVTLAQIIFEEEKKQRSFLPLQTLRNIIQNGGESFANLVTEAQRRMTSILPRRKEDEELEGAEAGDGSAASAEVETAAEPAATAAAAAEVAPAASAEATTTETADAAGSELPRKTREGLAAVRELREWVQQSQRAIDEWQQRMDDRIRHMVEGISPFAGVHKDVRALSERIASLESKLEHLASTEIADEAETRSEGAESRAADSGDATNTSEAAVANSAATSGATSVATSVDDASVGSAGEASSGSVGEAPVVDGAGTGDGAGAGRGEVNLTEVRLGDANLGPIQGEDARAGNGHNGEVADAHARPVIDAAVITLDSEAQ